MIDQLVNAISSHELLTIIDAFSNYNQIHIEPEDEEKIAFTIDQDIFYYRVMPFGLKNVCTTYQWLVNKIFKDEIRRNLEVYIDDMLVKSYLNGSHR